MKADAKKILNSLKETSLFFKLNKVVEQVLFIGDKNTL